MHKVSIHIIKKIFTLNFIIPSYFKTTKKVYLPKLNLLEIEFLNITMNDAVNLIKIKAHTNQKSTIFFINANTLNKAYEKSSFMRILNNTSYIFPDGSGVKIACNLMNRPLKENLNGTDMFPFICEMAEKEGLKLFFYGAKDNVAIKMKSNIIRKYPKLQIVGAINGYDLHNNEIINMINHSKADIVLVAKGAPLQEEWIDTYKNKITAPVIIGVGGLFDFYSGNIPRAPIWMRKAGIEWIFRLIQEPKRMWKRYIIGNPIFLIRVFLWNKKKKFNRIKYYYTIVPSTYKFTILPDLALTTHKFYPVGKRIMDITAASITIILLSPILLITAILIKAESHGSILFLQKRVGQNGKLFDMYKFRSMVHNAEKIKYNLNSENESKDGITFKIKNDPRITRIGKIIRKWSIDELPQLFNVLKGEMSMVGPRPSVPSEVSKYTSDNLKRLHIIPGITCYWQISGRSEIPFKQQVVLDKKYILKRSLWTDTKILLNTIPAVFIHKGAY